MNCRECEYCKMRSRADVTLAGNGIYGRGEFRCEHPETGKIPVKVFGNRMPGFIGFGTMDRRSVVQIKTHPRWCPLKKEHR